VKPTELNYYSSQQPPSSPLPSPNVALLKTTQLHAALGFKVGPSDQLGVLIGKVDSGSAAERAGVRVGDLLAYVNNRPTRNVDEFYAIVAHTHGSLYLTVRRRGFPKLVLCIKPGM